MTDDDWINADEAKRHLGVRAQTLYAYASRGLLRAVPDPGDARRSLYRRTEVTALAARNGRSRKLADIAAGAITWGEPVLQSAITTVKDGRLYYRGLDVVDLAEHANLEWVTRLLIGVPAMHVCQHERMPVPGAARPTERLYRALADRAAAFDAAVPTSGSNAAAEAAVLLDLVADAVVGGILPGLIHQRLAQGWGADPDGPVADLMRRVLVLLADHELNASTFAARVTASTGASLAAALLSGLAALSGPRHGGMGAMVRSLADEAEQHGPAIAVRARWKEQGFVPGFGHPLYPLGDIRARVLLARIVTPPLFAGIEAAATELALAPNVDFALAAICAVHGLPADAPFALFAAARAAGWLAHAIEQGASSELIRPRARYTGR